MPTDVIVVKLTPSLSSRGKYKYHPAKEKNRQQVNNNKKTTTKKQTSKKNRTSYHPPHAFMEDTIRHNIAHMTSKRGLYPLPSYH